MLKGLLSRAAYGRRAARMVEEARADLSDGRLATAIAVRMAVPVGRRPRPLAVRALNRAVADALRRAGLGSACLPRCLALLGDVRRLGFPASLVIGMRPCADRMDGHAWLEVGGRPFLEMPEPVGYVATRRAEPSEP